MITALVVIVLIVTLKYFYWTKWGKQISERSRVLKAIAKKLGIDEGNLD